MYIIVERKKHMPDNLMCLLFSGQDPKFIRKWIQGKKMRIPPDPDPQHCFQVPPFFGAKINRIRNVCKYDIDNNNKLFSNQGFILAYIRLKSMVYSYLNMLLRTYV